MGLTGIPTKYCPGALSTYLRAPQARDELPDDFSTPAQNSTPIVSLALITVFLSNVEARYESGVIWLIPLLAALLVLEWLNHKFTQDEESTLLCAITNDSQSSCESTVGLGRSHLAGNP